MVDGEEEVLQNSYKAHSIWAENSAEEGKQIIVSKCTISSLQGGREKGDAISNFGNA